jgi:UDP-sugar transporter A1/2/3
MYVCNAPISLFEANATLLFICSSQVFKLLTCFGVVANEKGGVSGLVSVLREDVWLKPGEMLKLSVPSLVYTVQNNLLYFALSHLNAATYMVCYQLKILTTAVFSTLMLNRRISPLQWGSLVLLTIGVSLAEYSSSQVCMDMIIYMCISI